MYIYTYILESENNFVYAIGYRIFCLKNYETNFKLASMDLQIFILSPINLMTTKYILMIFAIL